MERSLSYMGLKPNTKITDIKIDKVFIGSCTNGRIQDLREAARFLKDKKIAEHVNAMVVQGSGALASLKQSWKYSRGYGWDLFFGLVVTSVVSIIPSMFMLEGVDTSAGALSNSVLSIVGSCLAVWGLVFFYRAFDYVQANPRFLDEEA